MVCKCVEAALRGERPEFNRGCPVMSEILTFTWEADIPSAEAVRSCKGRNEGIN